MKRRQFIGASGIIFAVIFIVSAVLGDGILNGGTVTKASAKQPGEQAIVLPLPETIVTEPILFLVENAENNKIEAESNGEEELPVLKDIAPIEPMKEGQPESSQIKNSRTEHDQAESSQAKETQEKAESDSQTLGQEEETKTEEITSAEVKTAETEKKADSAEGKEDASDEDTSKAAQKKSKKKTVDYVIADVDTSLNIRKKPSTEAEIVGKLYRGAKATIVKRGKKWTKIKSGTVKGYVANEYLMFDEDAEQGAEKFGTKIAMVQTETLRIRKKPGTDAPVLDLAAEGERLVVADITNSKESVDSKESAAAKESGWVAIAYSEKEIGYVSAEYVSISIELEEAISIEEEQRLLEEKRREEEAAQAAKNGGNAASGGNAGNGSSVAATARGGVSVSADDAYLMAVIVYMEAGNQSYEGKLAVANVIVNRLLSGIWGNSVSSVIYAPGQFYSPSSARLQRYMKQGPTSSCVNAVSDALAGNNNIGDYMFFCTTWAANYSSYSRYTVIGDHCFYQR